MCGLARRNSETYLATWQSRAEYLRDARLESVGAFLPDRGLKESCRCQNRRLIVQVGECFVAALPHCNAHELVSPEQREAGSAVKTGHAALERMAEVNWRRQRLRGCRSATAHGAYRQPSAAPRYRFYHASRDGGRPAPARPL